MNVNGTQSSRNSVHMIRAIMAGRHEPGGLKGKVGNDESKGDGARLGVNPRAIWNDAISCDSMAFYTSSLFGREKIR